MHVFCFFLCIIGGKNMIKSRKDEIKKKSIDLHSKMDPVKRTQEKKYFGA